MPELTKRPRYFDRQLLTAEDFALAQDYQVSRRWLHNRSLHTWGILRGLELGFAAGATRATVNPGEALDNQGREIVLLAAAQTPDVAAFAGKTVFVTITYREVPSDPRPSDGVTDNARFTEAPLIEVAEAPPASTSPALTLGRLTVGADGKVTARDDGAEPNRRRRSGAVLGDPPAVLSVGSLGVGVSAPRSRLQLRSLTAIDEGPTTAGAWANIGSNSYYDGAWKRIDATKPGVNFHLNADGGGQEFRFLRSEATGATRNLAALGSATSFIAEGNVGIGTVSPASKLHVAGDLRVDMDIRLAAGRSIVAPGRLHISGDEILYLLNRNGVIIGKEWGGSGDLVVQGRIGVFGQPPTPRTPGWGGGIHTFDIEVEGTGWSRGGWLTGNRDVAENFKAEAVFQSGDVVKLHPERNIVVLSTTPNDPQICGIVSTEPGVLLNANPEVNAGEILVPIALSGRVPCKVVDENGPIRRGDLLTSSSVAGHAMRASTYDGTYAHRAGTILGKAMTSLSAGVGIIDVFVLPS